MSTQDQTYIVGDQSWTDLTNSTVTNYYLYGQKERPANLNDRLRPLTTDQSLQSSNGDQGTHYDIVLQIDENSFMSETGPGRIANAAYMPFVD